MCSDATLGVIQPPDLVVDVMRCDERGKLPLLYATVSRERSFDESRVRSVGFETHHISSQVPVDRSAESVLEVVPDQTLPGAEQVAQRRVAVQGLHGRWRAENSVAERVQPLAQRFNRLSSQGGRWPQLPAQTLDVMLEIDEVGQVAGEHGQLVMEVAQSAAEPLRVAAKLGPVLVLQALPESHPQ